MILSFSCLKLKFLSQKFCKPVTTLEKKKEKKNFPKNDSLWEYVVFVIGAYLLILTPIQVFSSPEVVYDNLLFTLIFTTLGITWQCYKMLIFGKEFILDLQQ